MNGPPEEPETGDPGHDDGGADPEEPESRLRGWIDPDDRLWRHPSEVAPGAAGRPVLSPPPKRRYRGPLMVLIGAAAVAAVGAFLVVLLSPSSQPPLRSAGGNAESDATLTTLTGPDSGVPPAAQIAAKSLVELQAGTAHGTVTLLGVAVADGGLVATTASLLSDVRSIYMVGTGGKLERASIVGTDAASDIALVDVPADVPIAPFADDATVAGGTPDTVLSLVSAGGPLDELHATAGSVTGVATDIPSGPASGMAAIISSPALPAVAAGDLLLNASGSVMGILCDPQSPTTSAATFLPTQLVLGVADDLRSTSRVVPGWLGVAGSDVAGGAGAKVDSISAGSPAVGHLQLGEVIVAVDAKPVRTFAELRSRLYVLTPGTTAQLSVQGAPGVAGTKVVNVKLSSSS
ncbi:MAG TPA: trypsin-like peptidase domain-containing protein [Acidimicrobiales bacterium]|nr:trypsin-like peptidase domain-containing protein [Acidimicrobiales bacterium]